MGCPGKRPALIGVVLLLASFGAGCEDPPIEPPPAPQATAGDLARIRQRGQLRVLIPRQLNSSHLRRHGYPLDLERELVRSYAESQSLHPIWIHVDSREDLIPFLMEGRGDLIAGNLTATPDRKKRVAFTVPIAVVREQVVTRARDSSLSGPAGLDGRRVAVRRSSSFWKAITALQNRHRGIEIEEVPEELDIDEIIHRVAAGIYDVTVADSNLVHAAMDYRDDIRIAFDLTGDRPVAWAVHKQSTELRQSMNRFLTEAQLTDRNDELRVDDLEMMRKRRVLRLLTRNTAATYFLWRGQLMGFEYELVREFARQHDMRLEVVVPPIGVDLLPWLSGGRGDIVAASLTPTESRIERGVAFTEPYNHVSLVIVARSIDRGLAGPADLVGRRVHVRRSSAYWVTLQELRDAGLNFDLVEVPEEIETEEIISRVADGEYDLTLADSHIVDIELSWRDDIRAAFPLKQSIPLSWAVRESNPQLKDALDRFLQREVRGLLYNVVYDKYFQDSRKIRRHLQGRSDVTRGISPYDDLVKKYAEQYGFDWRLIVAQMFQESRFQPDAESFAGARGLMQVLPTTGEELGFTNLTDPEEGIHAGVKYMQWLRERFEEDLSVRDRMWFTLAAYNAGAGHVRDARRLARAEGLNPNKWFGEVDQAMLLLSRPKYADAAPHGYCRCSEPVRYVRDIRARYNAYIELGEGNGNRARLERPANDKPRAAVAAGRAGREDRQAPAGAP